MLYRGSQPIFPIVNGGGNPPVVDTLTVTPSTTAQTLTPPSGTDGYNTVSVSAVTASIDSDIVAGNIKSGVNILGVSGNVIELAGETKTVTPSTTAQTITPSSGKNGLTTVTVSGVTSSIDANITAGNIKKDVSILGVTGNYEGSGSSTLTTKTITANGTYAASSDNADGYSSVTVSVSGGGGTKYGATGGTFLGDVDADGVLQVTNTSLTTLNFTGVKDIVDNGLMYRFCYVGIGSGSNMTYTAFRGLNIQYATFTDLEEISGERACHYAFERNPLISISFPKLETISGSYACAGMCCDCTSLTTVDLSNLTSIGSNNAFRQTFDGCTSLTSVVFSKLSVMGGTNTMYRAFNGCTSLQTLSFPALNSNSFGSSTNQFSQMLINVTGCTVHFPSNLQSVIGSWSYVTAGFGGTNTTVLFDLPATT